jgi:hypothetical protein
MNEEMGSESSDSESDDVVVVGLKSCLIKNY